MAGACLFTVPPTSGFRRSCFFIACCISAPPSPRPSRTCTQSGSRMRCGVVLSGISLSVVDTRPLECAATGRIVRGKISVERDGLPKSPDLFNFAPRRLPDIRRPPPLCRKFWQCCSRFEAQPSLAAARLEPVRRARQTPGVSARSIGGRTRLFRRAETDSASARCGARVAGRRSLAAIVSAPWLCRPSSSAKGRQRVVAAGAV